MKRILITGASSGIGKAAAQKLDRDGHSLVLLSRRKDALEEVQSTLKGDHLIIEADVTKPNEIESAIQQIDSKLGGLDTVLNNAGLGIFDPVAEGKLEDWHTMIDVNIKGVLNVLHSALPLLRKSKGHLINVGSVASHNVFPNSGVYCATKHAVLAISESIRIELAQEVRVTTISPGAVNTEFINQTNNQDLLKDYKSYFAAGMTPEIIADQISWAVNAPEDVVISEIMIRPNRQAK
ncbi:MAG: SDR family oxidoreductase [Flavobacteriales bacterium]|nr:SDR family oxidoreductase [Flavobacteriales bacterium]